MNFQAARLRFWSIRIGSPGFGVSALQNCTAKGRANTSPNWPSYRSPHDVADLPGPTTVCLRLKHTSDTVT